jgi:uncharacterized protein Yka (UPF0111/DUF47 family)
MKPINIEKLMGHSVGISDSYYRATERELLDDYLKAIPVLTISNESRLQDQIKKIEEETRNNETNIKSQLYEKEQRIAILTKGNSSNTDAIAALSDRVIKLANEIEMLKKNGVSTASLSS